MLSVVRHGRPLLIPLWGAAVGLDEAAIGVVFSVAAAIDMAMFYPAGQLIDRRGRRWALLPCLLVLAVSLALLPLATGFWSLLVVAALSGFGNGIGTGIVMTLGSDFSPENRRGEFLGVWRLVADLGGAVGPFAIGGLAAAFGLALATFATAAVGLLGAAITARWVPETLNRPVRPVGDD